MIKNQKAFYILLGLLSFTLASSMWIIKYYFIGFDADSPIWYRLSSAFLYGISVGCLLIFYFLKNKKA